MPKAGVHAKEMQMITKEQKAIVLNAVNTASDKWKFSFNSGDAAGCASQYEETAVMNARPFGTFTGITEIQSFWQQLIDDGFSDVEYINPKIEVIDEISAILTSGWKMNKELVA
jgi:ketosteroid isomerase-like protein